MEKILRPLTKNFEIMMSVIEEFKDLSMLSVIKLIGSFKANENQKKKK